MATIETTALWNDVIAEATVAKGGYIGDLMKLARAHIKDALDKGELTQGEAGQVYTSILPAAMQNGIGFAMQASTTTEKVKLTEAQTALAIRQAKGFDDDAKQKLLKQSLDSWSVAYSVAKDANAIPDTIKVDTIDQIMHNAMANLDIIPETREVTTDDTVLDKNPLGVPGA